MYQRVWILASAFLEFCFLRSVISALTEGSTTAVLMPRMKFSLGEDCLGRSRNSVTRGSRLNVLFKFDVINTRRPPRKRQG